jgi:hypothetical protein
MDRSGGQEVITFPSLARLLKYFPHRQEASRAYAQIIEKLGVKDIGNLPVKSRKARLPLQAVQDNFSQFAAAIEQLR